MHLFAEIYAYLRKRKVLFLAAFSVIVLALYVNEVREGSGYDVPESRYEIQPNLTEIHVGESVTFDLVDKQTGVAVPAVFEIVTPHNVPGDRGVFIDNTYMAPRWLTHEHYVTFTARASGEDELTEHVIEVLKDGWPRVGEAAWPGLSHMQPQPRPSFDPPIDNGLKLGESTRLTVGDGFDGEALVAYYQVEHQNKVVDYAGTISDDGLYTAPLVLPDPPEIHIFTVYYREGGEPGRISGIGATIQLIP